MSADRGIGIWPPADGILDEAAAVEERTTHPARTLVDTAAMREDLDDCTRDEQARTWAIASDALDALDATRAQVAEMVAADVRTEIAAARRRLAERAASYESTADRLAAKGFGEDASCMQTVAKELREVARELLS